MENKHPWLLQNNRAISGKKNEQIGEKKEKEA